LSEERKIESIQKMIREARLSGELIWHTEKAVLSVDDAVQVHHVGPENIMKCLCFIDKKVRVAGVIASSEVKVDMKKLQNATGLRKPRPMLPDELKARFNKELGEIDPLTLAEKVDLLFIDSSLLSKGFVIGSAGSKYCGVTITPEELLRVTKAKVEVLS
jgi:prolyl-tRNA editing enzyme YbaK/EbsC (Cys-tRNA(Pro) deacylase)